VSCHGLKVGRNFKEEGNMSLTSQNLSKKEKEIYEMMEREDPQTIAKRRLRIVKKFVNRNGNVSKRITNEIRTKIINPFRKKNNI
jgi:hypothetical protein